MTSPTRSPSAPCKTGELGHYLLHIYFSVFLERCDLISHLLILSVPIMKGGIFDIFDTVHASPSQINCTTLSNVSRRISLCISAWRACPSLHHGLQVGDPSPRESHKTITVTKGPKVCHLAQLIHSYIRQGLQKSCFWDKDSCSRNLILNSLPSAETFCQW